MPFEGVEWSFRAFARRRAVCLVFRALVVVKFILQAASTLENTDAKLQVIRKFSTNRNLSFVLRQETLFRAK